VSEPASASPSPPREGQLSAFWTTAAYKGGFLQGIGVGLLLAGISQFVRILSAERFGPLAVVLGVVLIVVGGLQVRSGRSRSAA